MAGTAEILQEYLVKLGFQTDAISLKKFEDSLGSTGKKVLSVGTAVAGAVLAVEAAAAAFAYSMRKIYFESELSNSSVKNIKALEYAGKQIGITGDAMGSAIHGMAQAMRLNPGLQGLIESFGVKVTGRDTSDVMLDFVGALKNMPEFTAAKYASMFGMDADTYRQMSTHLDELKKKKEEQLEMAKRYGLDLDKQKNSVLEYTNTLDKLEAKISMLGSLILVNMVIPFRNVTKELDSNIERLIRIANGDWKNPTKGTHYEPGAGKVFTKEGFVTPKSAPKSSVSKYSDYGVMDSTTGWDRSSKSLADSPLGKLIARGEGNYGSVNLGAAGGYKTGTVDLANMTVGQVMAAQKAKQFNAAGRYQIIGSTLSDAVKSLGLKGNEKFDKTTQDKIFEQYLIKTKHPEIANYLSGKSQDLYGAARGGSREWASVANPETGKSYYDKDGINKSSITSPEFMQALQATRLGGGASGSITMNQTTNINVTGTGAEATGRAVAQAQTRVNGDLTRNMKSPIL